jgi:biopolymer transport protein ExbD
MQPLLAEPMKLKRGKMLVDPPACASSDIAFTLIIFFLVCAAVQPETGMSQALPKTEEKSEKRDQSQNLEVSITPSSIILNGSPLKPTEFATRIAAALKAKTREADRIVVVKSAPGTPYPLWLAVSQSIDNAGGILTLELESEKTINVR